MGKVHIQFGMYLYVPGMYLQVMPAEEFSISTRKHSGYMGIIAVQCVHGYSIVFMGVPPGISVISGSIALWGALGILRSKPDYSSAPLGLISGWRT